MNGTAELAVAENRPNLVKNLLLVYGVSILDFSLSLLVNLLIPMIATKADFSNYRKLVLYASYAGFSHLGLLSGMYIYVVGKNKQELDWDLIAAIKWLLLASQMIVLPLVLAVLWITAPQGLGKLIITSSVVCWGMANLATFYNYLFQGINSFGVFFFVNMSVKVLSVILVCYIALTKTATTSGLVFIFVVPIFVTVLFYEVVWKIFTNGIITGFSIVRIKHKVLALWRRGVVLYVANVLILLLFSFGNLFVSLFFSSSEFANYSFAYGLTTVLYFAIDGLTAVVTPYLAGTIRTVNIRDASRQVYLVIVWLVPILFWLSALLVNRFFPQYLESIALLFYFSASLPFNILLRSRVVSIATALGLENTLLRFAAGGVSLTFVSILITYFLFHSIYGVALGGTVAMVIAGIVGVIAMGRVSGALVYSDYRLVANAIAATILYFLCAARGPALFSGFLYVLGAIVALLLNSRRMRSIIL